VRLRPAPKPAAARELRLRLEADTCADLAAYAELYAAEYGEAIDVPRLAAEILRQFLQNDRAFRSWKKRRDQEGRQPGRGDGREASADGGEASA
jgi:hypothetical protein